jgi:hypothetical protein
MIQPAASAHPLDDASLDEGCDAVIGRQSKRKEHFIFIAAWFNGVGGSEADPNDAQCINSLIVSPAKAAKAGVQGR